MTAEIIPFHNFTVETAHVKAEKVKSIDPSTPILLPENGGLTDGHQATINALVNTLVELRA